MEAILQDNSIKKPFKKLKVDCLNSDNIVNSLRQLLTKYWVHYEKIRHYNWSSTGSKCHELNREFKTIYQIIDNKINLIDCKVYDFKHHPQTKIEDALQEINMKEKMSLLGLLYQINDILNNFGQLHDAMLSSVNTSINISDSATKHLVTQFIHRMEEHN